MDGSGRLGLRVLDPAGPAEEVARLTLSTKTVDHHEQALLRKVGVSTRGQAAAEARRLDLVP